MAKVTLQVIQGLERGEIYSEVPLPLTVGREEDNAIQLNDERISRCHIKIQQDGERVILTDLESTNGTRVNGLPIQMTVLRPGDFITLGRCVLLFGSQEEINHHCGDLHKRSLESHRLINTGKTLPGINSDEAQEEHGSANMDTMGLFDEHGQPVVAFPDGPPPLPNPDSLKSRSELSDLLAYFHSRILQILEARGLNTPNDASEQDQVPFARIPWPHWYYLVNLETELTDYLKSISEPE